MTETQHIVRRSFTSILPSAVTLAWYGHAGAQDRDARLRAAPRRAAANAPRRRATALTHDSPQCKLGRRPQEQAACFQHASLVVNLSQRMNGPVQPSSQVQALSALHSSAGKWKQGLLLKSHLDASAVHSQSRASPHSASSLWAEQRRGAQTSPIEHPSWKSHLSTVRSEHR